MRGLGVSFLLRRARVSWLLLACVAVTVLLATGLAAVLWTFAGAVVPFGAQGFLADPQDRVLAINGPVNAREAAADSQQIRAALRQAWPGVGFQLESALWTDQLQLPSSGNPTATRQIQLASLAGISAQVTLTAGTWPGPPHRGGPVPAALPAAVASQLHLTVGSVLTATPMSGGAATSLQVTGLFRANDPASPYWALDLLPVSGMSVQRYSASYAGLSTSSSSTTYGPAVVNPAAFGGALTVRQASWMALPQAPALARGNLEALSTGTSAAVTQLNELLPEGLTVTSGLPQILAGIASTIVLTRSLFTIAALLLLLVAGAALVLAARLLAGLREEESALLRARGATRWQVVRPVLAEAVLVGAAAALAGVLAGTRLTARLAGSTAWPVAPGRPTPGRLYEPRHRPAGLAVGPGHAGRVRRGDDLAGAARPGSRRRQAPPRPAGPAGGDRLGGRRSGPGGARRGRGVGTARLFGGRASGHGIARDRSRGRPRPRTRAGRRGHHPAPRAAAAGEAGGQGNRPRTAAGRRHGELADRPAADPPGGPGPAPGGRRRDHHAGAGRVRELAAVGRGPGCLRGWLGCTGGRRGPAAAGRDRGDHPGTGCHRRHVGQPRQHRQRSPAGRAGREHGG